MEISILRNQLGDFLSKLNERLENLEKHFAKLNVQKQMKLPFKFFCPEKTLKK